MESNEIELLKVLEGINTNGVFCSTGEEKFCFPGLKIEGIDEEIALPLCNNQVKLIKKITHQAPFGKGRQTIIDTSVRSALELDNDQFSLNNPEWKNLINRIINQVQEELDITDQQVVANVYKILLYEKGDFFIRHRDSEKEERMFASLIVNLPSKHTGGELLISFDNKEKSFHSDKFSNDYSHPISFAAFYADCEHEVKPITSGNRLCLVYNLCYREGSTKNVETTRPIFSDYVFSVNKVLSQLHFEHLFKVLIFDHQYTPKNYSETNLKGTDKQKYNVLKEVLDKQGYNYKLALYTHYQMGDLEGLEYDHYDRDYEGKGSMGEIHDEYSRVEHWAKDQSTPELGNIDISRNQVIGLKDISVEVPIEEYEETYTGNYGMTMEYWYHYAALVIWKKEDHLLLLTEIDLHQKLDWLSYYLIPENSISENEQSSYVSKLSSLIIKEIESKSYPKIQDVTSLAKAYLFKETLYIDYSTIFSHYFLNITSEVLVKVFNTIPVKDISVILSNISFDKKETYLRHYIDMVYYSINTEEETTIVEFLIDRIPTIISVTKFAQTKGFSELIKKLISISSWRSSTTMKEWGNMVIKEMATKLTRNIVNEHLIPTLLKERPTNNDFSSKLWDKALNHLKHRVGDMPKMPSNWEMEIPISKNYQKEVNVLKNFLQSGIETSFLYKKNQSFRDAMKTAISNLKLDLTTETIRSSSPHTLKITKNRNSYHYKQKQWVKDQELLNSIISN